MMHHRSYDDDDDWEIGRRSCWREKEEEEEDCEVELPMGGGGEKGGRAEGGGIDGAKIMLYLPTNK